MLAWFLPAGEGQTNHRSGSTPHVLVEGSVEPTPNRKLRIELAEGRGTGETQTEGSFRFQAVGQPGDPVEVSVWDGSTKLKDETETLGTVIPWGILLPGGPAPATDPTVPRAVLLSMGLSLVAGLVDLQFRSKAELVSCFVKSSWPYVILIACFNTLAAAAASLLLKNSIPGGPWLTPFYYAVFGVFACQTVLSNTNITIFQKGVLSFEDWTAKAREPAVNAVQLNQSQRESDRAVRLAKRLTKLPDARLTAYLIEAFGQKDGAALIEAGYDYAAKYKADFKLYLALVFARTSPQKAKAAAEEAG